MDRSKHPLRAPRVAPSIASSLLVTGVLALSGAHAQESAEAATDEPVSTSAALAGTAAADTTTMLQPRWIDPRRGTAPAASGTEAVRAIAAERSGDWRTAATILVHGEPAAERLVDVVVSLLVRRGAESIESRDVDISASTDQVRFFHAGDAAMAAALAAELGTVFGEVRVRDLTFYRPAPSVGSLEIWLR